MCGKEKEYVHSPSGAESAQCIYHGQKTPQNTDRSSNCIQRIIKLHKLHHSCPDDSGGGKGVRFSLGLNARRVPMQFN